jgi:hypothetical protein
MSAWGTPREMKDGNENESTVVTVRWSSNHTTADGFPISLSKPRFIDVHVSVFV